MRSKREIILQIWFITCLAPKMDLLYTLLEIDTVFLEIHFGFRYHFDHMLETVLR